MNKKQNIDDRVKIKEENKLLKSKNKEKKKM